MRHIFKHPLLGRILTSILWGALGSAATLFFLKPYFTEQLRAADREFEQRLRAADQEFQDELRRTSESLQADIDELTEEARACERRRSEALATAHELAATVAARFDQLAGEPPQCDDVREAVVELGKVSQWLLQQFGAHLDHHGEADPPLCPPRPEAPDLVTRRSPAPSTPSHPVPDTVRLAHVRLP